MAPLSGVIAGGALFSRVGGYNSYKALHVIQIVGANAAIWGWGCSSSPTFGPFVAFIAMQLFFGGMTMPVATGLMLNQVPQNMRTVCNSIANMTYNLFGYVPAPYIYGFMYQRYGQGKSHAGFYTIEFFGTMSFMFGLIFFLRRKLAFRAYRKAKQLNQPEASSYNATNQVRCPSFNSSASTNSVSNTSRKASEYDAVEAMQLDVESNSE